MADNTRCEKCKKEIIGSNYEGYINVEVPLKLWEKGYIDTDFYLCKECLKKLYKFLGVKAKIKE